MSTDLFDRYAALDPADAPEAVPDWTAITPVLLAAIDEGAEPMQTQKRNRRARETRAHDGDRWSPPLRSQQSF